MSSDGEPRNDELERLEFEQLLERHLPTLRAYVRRNLDAALADRESTSDLVQSVCREVLQSRGQYTFRGDAARVSAPRALARI